MPQLSTVQVTDPVDGVTHSFAPVDISNGVAVLEVNTGVPIGNPRLTISTSKTAQGKRKFTAKLAMPVVQDQVIGGVTRKTVVRTAYADITFSFDQTSETDERRHIRSIFTTMFNSNNIVVDAIHDLSGFY